MAQFPSLPNVAHLTDLLVRFPKNIAPLMVYTNAVLRSEGHLSIGERELIASYVSGLNACDFCLGAHEIYAQAFGIPEGLLEQLLDDIETADIAPRLKPIFTYLKKMNTLPMRLAPADAQAVFDAGWEEEALFEAIEVSGLFNMMNRLVEGSGVNFNYSGNREQHTSQSSDKDALANSYLRYGKHLAELVEKKG